MTRRDWSVVIVQGLVFVLAAYIALVAWLSQ